MLAAPLWIVENVSEDRRKSLAEPFEFTELLQRLRSEVRNVRYKKEKGSHEAKGSWRPIIWFDVNEQTFDCFFNSPYGYRGQFLLGADAGRDANKQVLHALADTLVQGASLHPPLAEQVQLSLLSPHAKIWIDEDQHCPKNPELIIQISVPEWVAAATTVHKRLAEHDPTLTTKEVDRIYGVRAPSGFTLKVMGAWVGPDGSLSVVPSKLRRAEEIRAYGVS
jgi:hypothetical protein